MIIKIMLLVILIIAGPLIIKGYWIKNDDQNNTNNERWRKLPFPSKGLVLVKDEGDFPVCGGFNDGFDDSDCGDIVIK